MRKLANPYHAQAGLRTLALAQAMPVNVRERIEYTLLAHLDACKRNAGTTTSANVVALHLVIGAGVCKLKKQKVPHDLACKAFVEFNKACGRPDPVSLTTGEYTALRSFVKQYLTRILPTVSWGEYTQSELGAFICLKVEEELREEFMQYTRTPYE